MKKIFTIFVVGLPLTTEAMSLSWERFTGVINSGWKYLTGAKDSEDHSIKVEPKVESFVHDQHLEAKNPEDPSIKAESFIYLPLPGKNEPFFCYFDIDRYRDGIDRDRYSPYPRVI